ncbi:Alpha-1,2 mannosyltransferase KTR1 [Hypsizygus marmoreus]|uniref:Alpha-1,2 mannosyltransferase KTR1 n=1 Tax=Hypsizygus marmoreus TaxID=39966 RepID=A0A369JKK5_HYPMA|nr:Alpha-1,2 mannosyltransferase KTR1 [Hypsizygus marmoreus]
MRTGTRHGVVACIILTTLHFGLQYTHEGPVTGPSRISDDLYFEANATLNLQPRANATFVILARNSDLAEPFTEEFKTRISAVSGASMEFGVIPREHWYQPDWVDEDKAKKSREKMEEEDVVYGGSLSYRNMCRFNSGFFFKHPSMLKYRYYWRIE